MGKQGKRSESVAPRSQVARHWAHASLHFRLGTTLGALTSGYPVLRPDFADLASSMWVNAMTISAPQRH